MPEDCRKIANQSFFLFFKKRSNSGKCYDERRSATLGIPDLNPSFMDLDNRLHHGKSESIAGHGPALVSPIESFEDEFFRFIRNSTAGITDNQPDFFRIFFKSHGHCAVFRSKLDGIVQQIRSETLNLQLVAVQEHRSLRQMKVVIHILKI